jgi:SpoVK/Ycf46/Vps4 family AAA+-type ATPase
MGRRKQDDDMAFGEAVQWAVNGDNYKLSGEVAKKLPPGAYNCADDGWGHAMLSKTNLNLDELISFPDSLFSGVVDRITKFWTKERQYYNYGFLHKMGYLLYGPQGCGKSSLVYQILNNIVDAGHLCLLCDGRVDHFIECVQAVRQVEPKRPMVCVLEDIDALIDRYGDGELLQWLDGANKTDHVVVIATTNYPEKLDKRIVCRPRRFDRLIKVMPPEDLMRKKYFQAKLNQVGAEVTPVNDDELMQWVMLTEGLSFAALAELVISVKCMDNDLVETATLLRELEGNKPSSDFFFEQENEDDDKVTGGQLSAEELLKIENMIIDSPNPFAREPQAYEAVGASSNNGFDPSI